MIRSETDQNLGEIGGDTTSECPRCPPSVTLDLSQGQRILEHVGAHILYDPEVIQSMGPPLCGLCLRPSPLCKFFLMKGKGTHGRHRINQKLLRGCLMKMTYSYSIAAESTASSPCSNVPIQCPICPKSDPAVWKYFMKAHFEEKHNKLLAKHVDLWNILDFEQAEMKRIWVKRGQKMAKHTTKSKQLSLVVSDKHWAQIPSRCRHFYST